MIWLTAIGGLAIGIVIGVLYAGRLNHSNSRLQELENQIQNLEDNHKGYRDDVSDHFNMTAELVQHMTESYKEVYQHLATGAQDLCSQDVASKLLPGSSDTVFENKNNLEESKGPVPPKDYAAKQNPEQKGALSEDFGIERSKSTNNEEVSV
jgi:hypothetical protein